SAKRSIDEAEAAVVRQVFQMLPVRLHPNLPEIYRPHAAELQNALNDPLVKDEAAEAIGDLIEKVVLVPRAGDGGLDAVLHGDLGRFRAWCAEGKKRGSGLGREDRMWRTPSSLDVEAMGSPCHRHLGS